MQRRRCYDGKRWQATAETKILKGLMQPMADVKELWGTVAIAMIVNGSDYYFNGSDYYCDSDDYGDVGERYSDYYDDYTGTVAIMMMIMMVMGNGSDYDGYD